MPRLTHLERQLYIAVAASVHGKLVRITDGKGKPQMIAHIARMHAQAAVDEWRLSRRTQS